MDGFAEQMIARGPTLAEDGVTATGSMHIVDLRDAEAARAFAYEEPNYRAGVYAEAMMRRWRNLLGGTMWTHATDGPDSDRLLVIAHGSHDAAASGDVADGNPDVLAEHPLRDRLNVCGSLLTDDGLAWCGNVFAVERASRSAVEAALEADPFARAGFYGTIEIHRWRFGGRR
jgi:uncharacterized protein